jgi:hypothetical protein
MLYSIVHVYLPVRINIVFVSFGAVTYSYMQVLWTWVKLSVLGRQNCLNVIFGLGVSVPPW